MMIPEHEAAPQCRRQCESMSPTHRGRGAVFCQKRSGHEGDHRGYRKQWDDQGNLKPITEPIR